MPRKPFPDLRSQDEPAPKLVEETSAPGAAEQITTAVVDDISPDGVARVTLNGRERSEDAATVLRFASSSEASEALLGSTVLVLAPPSAQPVIVGIVGDRVWKNRDTVPAAEATAILPAGEARSVQLDKRCLHLEASEEIRLTCGKSSLVLRRDGSVVVRGVTIVSRASQSNKIRGGTVNIN